MYMINKNCVGCKALELTKKNRNAIIEIYFRNKLECPSIAENDNIFCIYKEMIDWKSLILDYKKKTNG